MDKYNYKPISSKAIEDATQFIRQQKALISWWRFVAFVTTIGWISTLLVALWMN